MGQNLECFVTDRVTGRTERRGYMQQLEREKTDMVNYIRELEKLLGDNGIEVQPFELSSYANAYPPGVIFDNLGNPIQDTASGDQWARVGSVWVRNYTSQPRRESQVGQSQVGQSQDGQSLLGHSLLGLGQVGLEKQPALETRPANRYLGVSYDNAPLSSIKGTTLSILGTAIDITSFDAPDIDEPPPGTHPKTPLYNKSVMAFLQSVTNINPPLENVDLPSRQDAFTYAEWYFLMISSFIPILHKPSFLKLVCSLALPPRTTQQ